MRIPSLRNVVIVAALLSAGFLIAWVRFLPHLGREAVWTDGESTLALADLDALRYALWDTAAPLQGETGSDADESGPARSDDGRWLVFAVGEAGLNVDLWLGEMVDGVARDVRPLHQLNTGYDELAPAFDGDTLYFASDRPGGEGGFDLYAAPFADGILGPARALPAPVNGPSDDLDPAPVADTGALAFASRREHGRRTDFDLWLAVPDDGDGWPTELADTLTLDADVTTVATADPPTSDPATTPGAATNWRVLRLDALNSPFDEREPAFDTAGRAVYFASNRAEGVGGFDLWRSLRRNDLWLEPQVLAGLATAADERAPTPSESGFGLLFSRRVPAGDLELFEARSVELHRLPGRMVGWFDLMLIALLLLLALLAWLGKRWEALDILYKCLLVSLLVHLLLLWWFREVPVEHEAVELPPAERTFQVRLAPSEQALASRAERNGQLDAVPERAAAESSAPTRESQSSDALADATSGDATPGEAAEMSLPELAAASAPERSASLAAESSARAAPQTAVELQDAAPAGPRRSADAPTLQVAAASAANIPMTRTGQASGDRPTRVVSATPDLGEVSGSSGAARPQAVSDSSQSLSVPVVAAGPDAPGRKQLVERPAERTSQGLARPLALAGPQAEAGARPGSGADAPELDLAGLAAAGGAARPERAPDRPGRSDRRGDGEPLPDRSGPVGPVAAAALQLPSAASSSAPGSPQPGASSNLSRPANDARLAAALPSLQGPPVETDGGGSGEAGASDSQPTSELATNGGLLADLGGSSTAPARRSSTSGSRRPSRTTPARPGSASTAGLLAAATAAPVQAPSMGQLALPSPALAATAPSAAPPSRMPTPSRLEQTPYRTRFGDARREALEEHGGSEETERAVADGLDYLASTQQRSGQWGGSDDYDDKYGHVAVGKTALCLLAFLGAGHTPDSNSEHADVAADAVTFLLGVQDPETGHFGYSSSYSHGVSTYALAECLALTRDDRLREPIQRAVAWILRQQDGTADPRRRGGWGYYYPDGREFDSWPRSSITAWQVMALESARLAGVSVPDAAFARARDFLLNAHRPDRGVILYAHDPSRLRERYWTLPGSTPAGLFALSLLGEDVVDEDWRSVIELITQREPEGRFRQPSNDDFVLRARTNLYYWYYATLVMLRHGGPEWDSWNRELQDTLLPAQQRDGSWPSVTLYGRYAGDEDGEDVYSTAMCVLTLEAYYRYFTPLLQIRTGGGHNAVSGPGR